VAYVLAHHPRGAAAVIRIEMSPDDAEIYVVHRDGIAVLSALRERIFESSAVNARPSCVAMSSGVGRLYVGDHVGDVTVLPVATPALQAVAG
jgi:hypothetical protein